MSIIYGVLSIILLISLLVGVVRIFLGPTQADRMLAAQLFGSVGVAILLLQSAFTQLGIDGRCLVSIDSCIDNGHRIC